MILPSKPAPLRIRLWGLLNALLLVLGVTESQYHTGKLSLQKICNSANISDLEIANSTLTLFAVGQTLSLARILQLDTPKCLLSQNTRPSNPDIERFLNGMRTGTSQLFGLANDFAASHCSHPLDFQPAAFQTTLPVSNGKSVETLIVACRVSNDGLDNGSRQLAQMHFLPNFDLVFNISLSVDASTTIVQMAEHVVAFLPYCSVFPDQLTPNSWTKNLGMGVKQPAMHSHYIDVLNLAKGCVHTFEVFGIPLHSHLYIPASGIGVFLVLQDEVTGIVQVYHLSTDPIRAYPFMSSDSVGVRMVKERCWENWRPVWEAFTPADAVLATEYRMSRSVTAVRLDLGEMSCWEKVAIFICFGIVALCVSYVISASIIIRRVEGIWRMPIGTSACNTLSSAAKNSCTAMASSATEICSNMSQVLVGLLSYVTVALTERTKQPQYEPIVGDHFAPGCSVNITSPPAVAPSVAKLGSSVAYPDPSASAARSRSYGRKQSHPQEGRLQQLLALSAHAERERKRGVFSNTHTIAGLPADHPQDPGYRIAVQGLGHGRADTYTYTGVESPKPKPTTTPLLPPSYQTSLQVHSPTHSGV